VNLEGIRAVAQAVDRIPVIGNGDVRNIADAAQMLRDTGCGGVAIGRGALLNPWIFAQLKRWEQTGDPGPPPSYDDRLNFMDRHFHLLVNQRSEHFACLTFRKVANWYCKVLRPGREVQQSLIRLESVRVFEDIVNQLRDAGPSRLWICQSEEVPAIPVPAGPVEHW
jgi:tRNA-dihydrouridine synthase